MEGFIEEDRLEDEVKNLDWINYQIADLLKLKSESEQKIIKLLRHKIDGQRTYTVGVHSVVITTGLNYSLDKKKYLELGQQLPEEFNPVHEKIAYYLDKKVIELGQKSGDKTVKSILKKIITTSDKKVNVKISAAN